jgi:hypothetical protein
MSGPVVELVVMRLKKGVNVMEDGPSKTILEECMAETNCRPGCHATYMGVAKEQPDMVYLIAGECKECAKATLCGYVI